MARKPLKELPADRFPLRWENYSAMYDQLQAAVRGFADLGYGDIACELDEARAQLAKAWDAIAAAEREGR